MTFQMNVPLVVLNSSSVNRDEVGGSCHKYHQQQKKRVCFYNCCISLPLPSIHKVAITSLICIPNGCNLSYALCPLYLSYSPSLKPLFLFNFFFVTCQDFPSVSQVAKVWRLDQRRYICPVIKVSSEVKNRLKIPANSLSMAGCLDWATLRDRAGKLD